VNFLLALIIVVI